MRIMKLDWTMVAWGVVFGISATLTGMFVLAAVEGGFLAEGFFLVVMGWVLLLVGIAKLTKKLKKMGSASSDEEMDRE
jgi:predicted phage tail protein